MLLNTDMETVMRFVMVSPVSMAVFDGEGRYVDGNAAYKRLFPETPVPEYSIFEDPIVERNGYSAEILKLKDGEIIGIPEMRYNPRDIKPEYPDIQVYMSLSATPLMGQDGKLEKVVVIYENLTAQRAAEQRLENMVRRFEVYSKKTVYGFGEIDPSGNFTYINRKVAEISGYSEAELLGMNIRDILGERAHASALENMQRSVTEAFSEPGLYPIMCRDGSEKFVEVNMVGLAEGGEVTGFQFTAQDVTDRVYAEEEVLKLNQFLGIVIDSANVWMNVLDENANIIMWNKAAEEISGYLREEVVGHGKIWEWLYPDAEYRKSIADKVQEIIHEGRAVEDFQTVIMAKDGSKKVISWHSKDLLDEAGSPIGAVTLGRDVTYENRAREETIQLQEQLVQAQKMEAMGTLAGGMAHDFNNSLSVILGNAEIALKGIKKDEQLKEKVQRIVKAAERAKELTTKLLTFSRKDILNRRAVPVNTVVGELIDILKRSVSKKIRLSVALDENAGNVSMDANQILQSFMNICINAADAMPGGGDLHISSRRETFGDDARSETMGLQPNEYCVVTVKDSGIGMDGETMKKIFEPFFTTKERGKGTGLGLSVTAGIIERHGGAVDVESAQGVGSVFRIYLPLSSEKCSEDEAPPAAPEAGAGEYILVVDDDRDFSEMIAETLEMEGYKPLVTHSGSEGIKILNDRKHDIGLLMVDMKMPEMDGAEVVKAVRRTCPSLPVVICSGYSEDGIAESLVADKAVSFIQKPFRSEDICSAINAAIKR